MTELCISLTVAEFIKLGFGIAIVSFVGSLGYSVLMGITKAILEFIMNRRKK